MKCLSGKEFLFLVGGGGVGVVGEGVTIFTDGRFLFVFLRKEEKD
jgi:hypothetical protein